MAIVWPDTSEETAKAWNTCVLGGIDLPGICTVGVKPGQVIDEKQPKGKSGTTQTRQGYKAARVTIGITMVSEEEYEAFQVALKSLWPIGLSRKTNAAPGKVDGPIPIEHPKTQLWGISAVQILDIDDPPNGRGDIYTVTIECAEYFPPPKVSATKTDSKTINPRENELQAKAPAAPSTNGNVP